MTTCQSLRSERFPDRELCEWVVQTTGKPPQTLNTNGEISPRELYSAVNHILEREWQQLFAHQSLLFQKRPQPIAEELYDRFHFLPPWLPKPLTKMSEEEKMVFNSFYISLKTRGVQETIHIFLRYVGLDAVVEDNFFGIFAEGAAGCVGMSNLDYFAEKIVDGNSAAFIALYQNSEGTPQSHIGVLLNQQPYDPSYQKWVTRGVRWFTLDPMDQWAISVMNTGLTRAQQSQISLDEYWQQYALRALDLAPSLEHDLGALLYSDGMRELILFIRSLQ